MISKGHPNLSISKQCKLLGVHRSGLYYEPKGESDLNLELMRLMDEHYLKHPYKGAGRMYDWLTLDMGYQVSKNRIERLYYQVMGLRSIMPGKHTTKRCKDHKVYPYLLRNFTIDQVNQVWATDICYIPMAKGFMYLTAIIDIHSRFVLNWSISNSMDARWCSQLMEQTIQQYGPPEIINTDQGSQYTSEEFTSVVLDSRWNIKLSMGGKGRATDNAFIEALWKTVKYEKIYPNPAQDGLELYKILAEYFHLDSLQYHQQTRHA